MTNQNKINLYNGVKPHPAPAAVYVVHILVSTSIIYTFISFHGLVMNSFYVCEPRHYSFVQKDLSQSFSRIRYLRGLGLGDAKDITVKGLEIVKAAKRVYLEAYTSLLTIGKDELERFYGRPVLLADRDMVEQNSDELFRDAADFDIVFLVVGDPFGATTHTDLILRAKENGIRWKVIHNASIMNAVGCCGLQLYNFGETISIVLWTETWKPDSFCDRINANLARGLHTLCLLDIKVKEQTVENMMRGKKIYEPPRFLTVPLACEQLLEVLKYRKDCEYTEETMCVGLARVGSEDQKIVAAPLEKLANYLDMGPPLHSLIVVGKMHPLEEEYIRQFYLENSSHGYEHPFK